MVVRIHDGLLIYGDTWVEEWFLVLRYYIVYGIFATLHHVDRHRVIERSYVLVRYLKGVLQHRLAGAIHGFSIHIIVVVECIILVVVLTEEDHGVVVVAIGGDILRQHLVAIYIAHMGRAAFREREDAIIEATCIVLGSYGDKEHNLDIVVRVEELTCHQRVDFHIANKEVCFCQLEGLVECTYQVVVVVVDTDFGGSHFAILRGVGSGVGPCRAVRTCEETVVIYRTDGSDGRGQCGSHEAHEHAQCHTKNCNKSFHSIFSFVS